VLGAIVLDVEPTFNKFLSSRVRPVRHASVDRTLQFIRDAARFIRRTGL